jgi:hypothetical protein
MSWSHLLNFVVLFVVDIACSVKGTILERILKSSCSHWNSFPNAQSPMGLKMSIINMFYEWQIVPMLKFYWKLIINVRSFLTVEKIIFMVCLFIGYWFYLAIRTHPPFQCEIWMKNYFITCPDNLTQTVLFLISPSFGLLQVNKIIFSWNIYLVVYRSLPFLHIPLLTPEIWYILNALWLLVWSVYLVIMYEFCFICISQQWRNLHLQVSHKLCQSKAVRITTAIILIQSSWIYEFQYLP